MKDTAFFVQTPRRLEDLLKLHLTEQERAFTIAGVVVLGKMDYENFAGDMLADRAFLEPWAPQCERGEVWRCVLVQQRGRSDGVLVIPEDGCYVGWAAYASE